MSDNWIRETEKRRLTLNQDGHRASISLDRATKRDWWSWEVRSYTPVSSRWVAGGLEKTQADAKWVAECVIAARVWRSNNTPW